MKPWHYPSLLACGLLLFAACDRHAPLDTTRPTGDESVVLAQVGDSTITRADFDRELARRRGSQAHRYTTPEQLEKLLAEMIQFEVVLAAARSAGFDRDPEIQARINQFIVSRFQEGQLATMEFEAPTEAELQAYYEANLHKFAVPSAVRVAGIQLKLSSKATAEKRDELRARAEALWNESRAGEAAAFARLARLHSEDQATRYLGGEIGWSTPEQLTERYGETVSTAVFALAESGSITQLIEGPEGFFIARLLEQRGQQVRPFAAVRDVIGYDVSQQKERERQSKLFSQMQQNVRVKSYPDRLPAPVATNQITETSPPPVPKS